MYSSFEEKGKIFTQVISKIPVNVIVQTPTQRILGEVHLRQDERLIDMLNQMHGFLAMTNVTILDQQGQPLYRCNFLPISTQHIIWILPGDEIIGTESET